MRQKTVVPGVVVLVCAIGVSGGPALALTPKNPRVAREMRRERHVSDLVSKATNRAQRTTKSCRTGFHEPATTVSQEATPQSVKDSIGALRRPATVEDAIDIAKVGFGGLGVVYADSVRTLTAANGRRFVVFVARRSEPRFVVDKSCLDAQHRELVKVLRRESRGVRSAALRSFARQRRYQEGEATKPPRPAYDAIYVFDRTKDGIGSGGGGIDPASFRRGGEFGSSGGSRWKATVSGLVPDGVATIDVTFAKRASYGARYKPVVYPSAIRKTIRVHDNLVVFDVRRAAPNAFPTRMVWRDAQGKVVRVVKGD